MPTRRGRPPARFASASLTCVVLACAAGPFAAARGAGAQQLGPATGTEVEIEVGSVILALDRPKRPVTVTLRASGAEVASTRNDLRFSPHFRISEAMGTATTLAADVGAEDRSIPVVDARALPEVGLIRVDDELIAYAGIAAGALIVTGRGEEGTTAAFHLAGAAAQTPTDVPDCWPTEELRALGKSARFEFLPAGCVPGRCLGLRAAVLSLSGIETIPDGTPMYRCLVESGELLLGSFEISCPEGELPEPPFDVAQATTPDGAELDTTCPDGIVTIADGGPARVVTGSLAVPPGGQGSFDVWVRFLGLDVSGFLIDVQFDPRVFVAEATMVATVLTAAVGPTDDLIPVVDAAGLPAFGTVRVDDELVLYSGTEGDALAVARRGADGSAAVAHQAGAPVNVLSALPDCRPSDELTALGKSAVFSFLPHGCAPGLDCDTVRAIVVSLDDVDPIPENMVLYRCTARAGAPQGTYPLFCVDARASSPPDRQTGRARLLLPGCADGEVRVRVDATPTPTETPATPTTISCVGDCDADGSTGVEELIRAVQIAVGRRPLRDCENADADGNARVTIDELVLAVTRALAGCPG